MQRAGFCRRLAAFFYDGFLLFAMYFVIGGVAVAINRGETISLEWSLLIFWLIFPLLALCFYCWFWRRCGQTLGMQAWRIKLIADKNPPPIGLCIARFLVSVASLALFGLGFILMLFDKNNRAWQDIATKSYIVLLPKQ